MYLEAEVYGLLAWGFGAVALIAAAVLLLLFLKSRNVHVLWFGGQLTALTLALAGLCWGLSMVFMLIGIFQLLRKRAVIYQF